jgi:hypothetical protein
MGAVGEDAMRLLLVEDARKAARVVRRGLEEEGFTVDVAHSGNEAEELGATVTAPIGSGSTEAHGGGLRQVRSPASRFRSGQRR